MTDPDARRAANEATLNAVLAAITAGAYDTLADHVTDDLVFELPYAPPGIPARIEGRETWDQMQRMTFALFSSFSNVLDTVHPGVDPDRLIAEYHSDAVVARNQKPYRNRYIGVFEFRDGRICSWREYHDPNATAVLAE